MVSSILPKNELENSNFCPSLLGQRFFVRFLEELKNPEFSFEINWLLKTTTTFLSDPTVLLCILRALVPRVSKLLCICILHTASLTIFHLLPFPVIFRAAINCEGEFQDCVLFYVKSQRLVRNFLIQRVSFFFNFENGHDWFCKKTNNNYDL